MSASFVSPFARCAFADARSDEMGVSEGMSEDKRARTREFEERRVAAKARTERLTIIMTEFGNQFKNIALSMRSGQWMEIH